MAIVFAAMLMFGFIVMASLVILSLSNNAFAATVELPKTGQTASYDTGDDGDKQEGVAWPSPRFTDNSNGTVTDNLTGLVWLKNANCFGMRNWTTALNDANTLADGACGLADASTAGQRRLPNRKELRSLVDYSKSNPALPNGHPFTNAQSNWYWSSTTRASSTVDAWGVYMWNGVVDGGNKDSNVFVWPVRSGSGGSLYNLAILKDGTGSGTVTSSPAGIDCGADCSESYASGTSVTLTTAADAGLTFAGWSGDADCSDGSVTMDADKTCTATFNLNQRTLTVTKAGTGSGTVTGGANCTLNWVGNTGTCTVNHGTAITLSGSANAGSTFGGWSGGTGSASACLGTGNCTFNITAGSGVTATFTLIPPPPPDPPEPNPEIIPNNSPRINYFGGWHGENTPCGTLMEMENITGAFSSMTLTFEGTHISWRAMAGPAGGTAKVYIDGSYAGAVNLYRAHTECEVEVFSYALSAGMHTIRITPEPLLPGRSINIGFFVVTR